MKSKVPTIGHGIFAGLLDVRLLDVPLGQRKVLVFVHAAQTHHLHLFALVGGHKDHLFQAEHLAEQCSGVQLGAGAQIDADPLRLTEHLALEHLFRAMMMIMQITDNDDNPSLTLPWP